MPDLASSNLTGPNPTTCEQETINPKPQHAPRKQRSNSYADTTVVAHRLKISPRRDSLSPSELEIHTASQASSSSKRAFQSSSRGALPFPDLGSTHHGDYYQMYHTVVVHQSNDGKEMETRATDLKRLRASSSLLQYHKVKVSEYLLRTVTKL